MSSAAASTSASSSPASKVLAPKKPISRATGKEMSKKEADFARLASPTGKLFIDEDCVIPHIGSAGVKALIANGVTTYDQIKAKFLDLDGNEKDFADWLESKGVGASYAKKTAICYADK